MKNSIWFYFTATLWSSILKLYHQTNSVTTLFWSIKYKILVNKWRTQYNFFNKLWLILLPFLPCLDSLFLLPFTKFLVFPITWVQYESCFLFDFFFLIRFPLFSLSSILAFLLKSFSERYELLSGIPFQNSAALILICLIPSSSRPPFCFFPL